MKILWILSALIGFALPEKLDRTYLPPPGSKFSGGSPGENDVPLEFPKETYTSSSQDNNFGLPEIAIGIERLGSNISPKKYGVITSTVPSFHGNSYGLPTSTSSYEFPETTSHIPAVDPSNEPEISMSSKYPFGLVNNPTSSYLKEKNLIFDHAGPNNNYIAVGGKKKLNDINNNLENESPGNKIDNKINPQVIIKTNDESVHSNNGDVTRIPEDNSHSNDLSTPGITSIPTEINHSLLNNNYNSYHSPPLSESIMEQDLNLISSTPKPSENVYYNTPSQYGSVSQIGITNSPYKYRPERIQAQDREAVILTYDNKITPDGYAYSFDTSNGIHADEKGIAINGVQAVGSYSYIGDDGQLYSVNYTADENGFRPQGAHLPTAPPIPDAILKVLEQAAMDKANGIYDDGSYDEKKYGHQRYNPTKNIGFLNQYNKGREVTNLNQTKSNNQIPHYTRSDKNINKDNNTDKENKQNVINEDTLQPFIKKDLRNESLSEISPFYKSGDVANIEKDHIDISNHGYDNKLQNEILNAMPVSKETVKDDRIMNIEFYDETGYHYSKPQNGYSSKAANKLINRYPDTPASIKIPAMYKQTMEDTPASSQPPMTPYVPQNNIFVKHEGDDQPFEIPKKFNEEQSVILSNQNTSPFPISAEKKRLPGQTENRITHNFNNQFTLPDILPSNEKEYLNIKNDDSNRDSYVPFVTSTEIGFSDMTSTIPTAFSRDNARNPTKYSEIGLIQNQSAFNPSLDYEKYREPLTHSDKLEHYGNINNNDDDAGSGYNIPNTYAAHRDNNIIHQTTAKTYSEDFSGPKQAQEYDPLTGYYY